VGVPAIFEQGIPIDSLGITRGFATFESNVLFVLRFMVDCSIVGGNWLELPAGTYSRTMADSPLRLSHCQIEVHCHFSTIMSHPPEGDLPTCTSERTHNTVPAFTYWTKEVFYPRNRNNQLTHRTTVQYFLQWFDIESGTPVHLLS
jgi:hypothetical protein